MIYSPVLSIIVPVYNSSASLPKCLDSIIGQTFKSFELLLINDGSKDASLDICSEYSRMDQRIKILDKPNGGVSSARNVGLDNATGDWIMFVDSDDWLFDNCIDSMLVPKSSQADLVIGTIYSQSSQSWYQLNLGTYTRACESSSLATLISTSITHPCISAPVAKLYKRDLVERMQLRFDEKLYFGEDSIFVKSYLLNAKKVEVINEPCYYYCDIGDTEFYLKYNKDFGPINDYFSKSLALYRSLEEAFNISVPTEALVGIVFELMVKCIVNNGTNDGDSACSFLANEVAMKTLRQRQSCYINLLILVAKCNAGGLVTGMVRVVESLRSRLNL